MLTSTWDDVHTHEQLTSLTNVSTSVAQLFAAATGVADAAAAAATELVGVRRRRRLGRGLVMLLHDGELRYCAGCGDGGAGECRKRLPTCSAMACIEYIEAVSC